MKQVTAIFIAIIIAFSVECVTAQEKTHRKKSFLTLQAGAGFPIGDFGSTNQNSEKSGYAQTGFSGALKYTASVSNYFGISFGMRSNTNPLNTSQFKLQIQQQLPPGVSVSISADSWSTLSFLVGGELLEPLSSTSKSIFDLSFMIGYMSATSPAISVTQTYGNLGAFFNAPSNDAGAFAYLIGAGLYLSVSENVSIPITVDFLGATPHFESSTASTSAGAFILEEYDQPINSFSLMTGIVIGF